MEKSFHGIVHGKIIELTDESGLPDGERVEVTIRPESAAQDWGEGLRRCAGVLADSWTDEDDRILERIEEERRSDTRSELDD